MSKTVSILWKEGPVSGTIALFNSGRIEKLASAGNAQITGSQFTLGNGERRLDIEITGAQAETGPFATVVNVRADKGPFSFFLRDVSDAWPICIPQYGVAVTVAGDERSYDGIVSAIGAGGLQTRLQEIAGQPEESFAEASKATRDLKCVTWLGLSRDIRNFEINFHALKFANDRWDSVLPKNHAFDVSLPELGGKAVRYEYFCGRGFSCTLDRKRWLENGVLPILNACLNDEEISYNYKIFVSLEKNALKPENVPGTHYLVVDKYSNDSMQTPEQQKRCEELHDGEICRDEETVCFVRVQAVNAGKTPKYSYMRIPQPNIDPASDQVNVRYDGSSGLGSFGDDSVFLVAHVNGRPVPGIEMTVLLAPGEKAEYVFKIPHRPIPVARAVALAKVSFSEKLAECTAYWEGKLNVMATVSLPEKRINEMMHAGMLHCDLVAYGKEPSGAVAQTIGHYNPIGSESAPIIQYVDSMGLHDLARRSIMYFVEKQHDDGFMQNFGGYMLETGCVLWTIGEHWRYTRDDAWVRSIRDNIVKAVDYIVAWRNRSKREELRGRGYGMIDGKVCDYEDHYHIFMLNSTAYIGIKRAAEVLSAISDIRAFRIAAEAADYLKDITESLDTSFAEAPVVPLGNGAWCPSMPVWTETAGSICLQVSGGAWFSHGSAVSRDTLVSTQYLLLDEVIEPRHVYADFILNCLADNFFRQNTCFSQPYYSPHPWANLMRGEVKAFLKEFYTNMSSLADRETYTFWEHYFYASPHKTHEEGWFLMRSRWILYLEADDTLKILPGIPRAWLENGREIHLHGVACYFGKLHVDAISDIANGKIAVRVRVDGELGRLPRKLAVRVPHPQGMKAVSVSAGSYDPNEEAVMIEGFTGEASIEANF